METYKTIQSNKSLIDKEENIVGKTVTGVTRYTRGYSGDEKYLCIWFGDWYALYMSTDYNTLRFVQDGKELQYAEEAKAHLGIIDMDLYIAQEQKKKEEEELKVREYDLQELDRLKRFYPKADLSTLEKAIYDRLESEKQQVSKRIKKVK